MKLEEDGKYYFDVEPKKELEGEFFESIIKGLIENRETIHEEKISGKIFYFEFQAKASYIYTDSNNKIEVSNSPLKIEFKTENKTEQRFIISLSQFNKTLKYFGINFPWSKNIMLNEDNLKKLIYHNILINNKVVTIEDANIFQEIKLDQKKNENGSIFENINKITKLEDLSKYIDKYLKYNIEIFKYEEKDFIDEKKYEISTKSNFEIFDLYGRILYIGVLEDISDKEYFFTGPYSIGKTFTLLLFANNNTKKSRKAYFNLEILKSNKQYFEILAYESRNLFDDNETWKNTFIEIKDKEKRDPLSIISYLITKVSSKEKDTKYFFILDQIKFQSISKYDIEFQGIQSLRQLIKQTQNCFLIGCCSINYKGVKDILFGNWFSIKNDPSTINLNYIRTFNKGGQNHKNYKDNKVLKLLGFLPRFINIKDNLNKKILNISTKKIKEKIIKYYNKNKLLSISNLTKIEINKPFENRNAFQLFLERIPFKYFIINDEESSVDYSYPLVKRAIKELIDTNEIDNFNGTNEAERGWNFERRVIDKIKTTHVFGDYYIDNYIEIPTIYRKYKIEDELFSNSENNLFYFTYFNVRRYDCAIYLYDLKELILIQISIKKQKKQLKKYNKENLIKDANDIQKFLKINNIEVKKYYFFFILDEKNYKDTQYLDLFESFKFKYCLFNHEKNNFASIIGDFNIINYSNDDIKDINDEDEKIYEFGIKDNSFIFGNNIKIFRFYAEKGMTLKDFIEQTFSEDDDMIERFQEKFRYDENKFYLHKLQTLFDKEFRVDDLIDDETTILFLNLSQGNLLIGTGKTKNGKCTLSFDYSVYFSSFSEFNEKQSIINMTGFIFKSNEKIFIK